MTITAELEQLKAAHRVTWASGNYDAVAQAFVRESAPPPSPRPPSARRGRPRRRRRLRQRRDPGRLGRRARHRARPRPRAARRRRGVRRRGGRRRSTGCRATRRTCRSPTRRFDVAFSVVGVQFAPRHEATAAELVRVTRPGGRIVLAYWTPAGFIGRMFKTMAPYMPKPPAGASLAAAVRRRGPRPRAVRRARRRARVRAPPGDVPRRLAAPRGSSSWPTTTARSSRPARSSPRTAAGSSSRRTSSRCARRRRRRRRVLRGALGVPGRPRPQAGMTMAAGELRIDAGYAGLPELAHGGYRGRDALGGPGRREHPRPAAPTGPHRARRCASIRPAPGLAELHDGAGLLADARRHGRPDPGAPGSSVPRRRGPHRTASPARPHHPIPGCLVCGPAHPAGLHVTPGPVSGRAVVAAHWVPSAGHAGPDGDASAGAGQRGARLPAAVGPDGCTSPRRRRTASVTSVLETRLDAPVRAGVPHVVIGWPIGRDGRRWLAGAAIVGPDGELCAAGRQTAAVVGGLGRPARPRPLGVGPGCHGLAAPRTLPQPWTGVRRPRS